MSFSAPDQGHCTADRCHFQGHRCHGRRGSESIDGETVKRERYARAIPGEWPPFLIAARLKAACRGLARSDAHKMPRYQGARLLALPHRLSSRADTIWVAYIQSRLEGLEP